MGTERRSNRREFIKKVSGISGGIILAGIGIARATNESKEEGTDKKRPEHWYGMGIDLELCIGCGRCANACKTENKVSREPFFFRTWVEQYTVKKDGEVKVESPNGGIDGFTQSVPDEDIFKSFFVPKLCNHCADSPCVQVCPVGATFETPDGVVLVDQDYCIGCRYCVQACPYGCRYIDPEKQVVDKCTLCYHRITDGKQPACVEVCPTHSRIFGDLYDKSSDLVRFMRKNSTQVLKPHLNTGSKTFYSGLSKEVK